MSFVFLQLIMLLNAGFSGGVHTRLINKTPDKPAQTGALSEV